MIAALVAGGLFFSYADVKSQDRANNDASSNISVVESVLEVVSPSLRGNGTLRIPFYEVGSVQYFSTGVGIEERQATYPVFPLKLIFVEGERAYLTEVAISIMNSQGTTVIAIPEEHVTGSWLFVKAPPGIYSITATHQKDTAIERKVKIHEQSSSAIYFRWQNH